MVDRAAAAKFELLRGIYDLARFDALLDEREVLLGRLGRLAADATELPPNVVPFPRADSHGVDDDALALDTVIQGILDYDRHNEQLLFAQRAELLESFPQLQAARRGARGYRPPAPPPRFIHRAS